MLKAVNTLSESTYERLRADIIGGKLAPDTKLRIEELRKRYDISASPLREALSRLSGTGLVVAEGQRGFAVAPMSAKDLDEITHLRIMLECDAIRRSIANGDDDWEADLVASFHRLSKLAEAQDEDVTAFERANQSFHEALIEACDSSWLLRLRHTLYEQHRRYRMISFLDDDHDRDVHAEHEAIYEATLARDADAACKATETHIMRTAELTRRALAAAEE